MTNAQIKSISGTISTAQSHSKAQVNELVLEILLLEEPEEMALCAETLKEVCKPV